MKRAFKTIATMFHQVDPKANFAFEFWDGERVCYGDMSCPSAVTLRLKSPDTAKQILVNGFLGFGEAYINGEAELEGDLQELMRLGLCIGFDRTPLSPWRRLLFWLNRTATPNTSRRAADNICHHYDRGEDFYVLYLDPTMTYSCAYFRSSGDSLEQAQRQKYEHIARKLLLKPGERLLDIGCGWGGMLIYAVQNFGVTAVGNTISRSQYEYARRKVNELDLRGQIEVVCEDYRNLTGKFDKIVSIGMFEHVGKKFIPIFMQKVSQLLEKGGLGLLHTIGKDAPSGSDPWVWKYIFPGGYLPTPDEIFREMGKVGLSVLDLENLRLHYARTLDLWVKNYERNVEKIRQMFGDAFVRMWRLYLHLSSAGFKYGESRLYQVLFSHGLNNELPMIRDHVYIQGLV
jgi:cyclopropane-fatty-acyl-phospholipid synthase